MIDSSEKKSGQISRSKCICYNIFHNALPEIFDQKRNSIIALQHLYISTRLPMIPSLLACLEGTRFDHHINHAVRR